jgi:hypothetical protein
LVKNYGKGLEITIPNFIIHGHVKECITQGILHPLPLHGFEHMSAKGALENKNKNNKQKQKKTSTCTCTTIVTMLIVLH